MLHLSAHATRLWSDENIVTARVHSANHLSRFLWVRVTFELSLSRSELFDATLRVRLRCNDSSRTALS
jgi:hypothetical protein